MTIDDALIDNLFDYWDDPKGSGFKNEREVITDYCGDISEGDKRHILAVAMEEYRREHMEVVHGPRSKPRGKYDPEDDY